jgi:hypothetical protein
MLKKYIISVCIDGHYYAEDASCPWQWKGSGVFDYKVKDSADIKLVVWALSEEQARIVAQNYDYEHDYDWDIDDVSIRSIEYIQDLPDRDEDEVGVIDVL